MIIPQFVDSFPIYRRLSRAWMLGVTQSGQLPRAPGGSRVVVAGACKGSSCQSRWRRVEYSEYNLAWYAVHPGETVRSSRVSVFSENVIWPGYQHLIRVDGHLLSCSWDTVINGMLMPKMAPAATPNVVGLSSGGWPVAPPSITCRREAPWNDWDTGVVFAVGTLMLKRLFAGLGARGDPAGSAT
ncbi:hypothetical protein TIFTF001_005552 [Ficus carica]|uniref:Uncharacterized protein n=1 Tax=Ficus carica TaxID=3494 RepID=A0AA87ZYG4_FICCA|nr:hypothetical protein TIFTF001_005552 [Ficus carica]